MVMELEREDEFIEQQSQGFTLEFLAVSDGKSTQLKEKGIYWFTYQKRKSRVGGITVGTWTSSQTRIRI